MKVSRNLIYWLAIAAFLLMVLGCGPQKAPIDVSPASHIDAVPDETKISLSAFKASLEETVDAKIKLDKARTDIANVQNERDAIQHRLDVQVSGDENRKNLTSAATLKKFGLYSLGFTVIGAGLLVLGLLPWTAKWFSGTGSVALLLMGIGVALAFAPMAYEEFGKYAIIPGIIICLAYIAIIMYLDVRRRIRKANAEAVVAVKALDPNAPEGINDLIEVRKQNNPTFAAALTKEGIT